MSIMDTRSEYDRLRAQIDAERAEIAADYEALAEQHEAELAKLREIARAYRSILWGADGRGALDDAGRAELQLVDDRHGETIDPD